MTEFKSMAEKRRHDWLKLQKEQPSKFMSLEEFKQKYTFTEANTEQAEGRFHRMGQKKMEYSKPDVESLDNINKWKAQQKLPITYNFVDNYMELIGDSSTIKASVPYMNGFCINPVKCAGLTSCPRDRACSE